MINPRQVIVRFAEPDVFRIVILPLDIQFSKDDYDGLYWWWNEEYNLLIDSYGIMRKTNKDSFFILYKKVPEFFHHWARRIKINEMSMEIGLFKHWLNATT